MADDELSQREKRMQRHKETVRKDLPKTVAKTYGVWLLVILVGGAAAYGIYKTATAPDACPGHWHATFKVFVPGPGGQPHLVDLSSERAANGGAYYDLNGGAGMGYDVHMHQSGSERGREEHASTQWHYEPTTNSCVSVKTSLHAIEIDATATSLKLFGAHAQVGEDKTWEANATAHLSVFVQSKSGGNWTWSERSWDDVKGYQLKDGESLLVAFGNYTAEQVKQMEAGIPAPISRT